MATFYVILGGAIIASYYLYKFSRWSAEDAPLYKLPPRNYAPACRFFLVGVLYMFIFLGLYLLIVFRSEDFNLIAEKFSSSLGLTDIKAPDSSPPAEAAAKGATQHTKETVLWAIVFLTSVVGAAPPLRKLEHRLRKTMHKWARVPTHVHSIIRRIAQDATFHPAQGEFETFQQNILERMRCPGDSRCLTQSALFRPYAKALYLQQQLSTWSPGQSSGFLGGTCKNLFKHYQDSLQEVRQEMEAYCKTTERSILLEDFERRMRPRLNDILEIAYEIISCGVNKCKITKNSKQKEYRHFGLHPDFLPTLPVTYGISFLLVFIASVPVFIGAAFLPGAPSPSGQEQATPFIWAGITLAMHYLAIMAANILLKLDVDQYGAQGANILENPTGILRKTTWGFVGGSVVGCAILAGIIGPRLATQWHYLIWALCPGVTGAATAYYILRIYTERPSVVYGLIQGGLSLAAAFLALLGTGQRDQLGSTINITLLALPLLVGFIVGLLFTPAFKRRLREAGYMPPAPTPGTNTSVPAEAE